MIGGQLHDEGRRVAGEGLRLFQDDAGEDDGRHADEVGGYGHQTAAAEDGAGEQADNGHFRAAGHKTGGHNGHPAVPLIFNSTGGHHAGDAAAGADQHGDEALAGEAELPENPVHDEGDSGHVAHVLQNGQHEEQHQHLGHKAQHRAHAGDDAVGHQAGEPLGAAPALQQGTGAVREPGAAQHVVGPVRQEGAEGTHGDPVHQEHDHGENGQGQNAVGDDPVDLVGGGQILFIGLFLHRLGHHAVDVGVPLVGDDALGVVIQFLFAVGDVLFQVLRQGLVQPQVRQDFFIPLEELDGVPAEIPFIHLALDGFLDMCKGVLHAAGKHMGQFHRLAALCQSHCFSGGLHAALALQGAHLHDLAAQSRAQSGKVDGIAVLPHQVDHVDRHHHRQSQLNELRGEIQVPLDVGSVHDVQNGVGLLIHQIAPGHHFLQGVGGQGVNAWQVLNDHIPASFEPALLLFNRNAGPVAHVLVGTGQGIEQGRLAAVRIARQRNFEFHSALLS